MPSTTALQGLPYPVGATDAPDGPAQILALAQAAEKRLVMVFATAAARTAALTAAGVTAAEGMVSWLQDVDRHEKYTGAAWVPLTGRLKPNSGSTSFASDLNSTGASEAVGYSAPYSLVSGRTYRVWVKLYASISVAGIGQAVVRYSTAALSTASTAAGTVQIRMDVAGGSGQQHAFGWVEFTAPSTATYNLGLGVRSSLGGGNFSALGTSDPTSIRVEDITD